MQTLSPIQHYERVVESQFFKFAILNGAPPDCGCETHIDCVCQYDDFVHSMKFSYPIQKEDRKLVCHAIIEMKTELNHEYEFVDDDNLFDLFAVYYLLVNAYKFNRRLKDM